MKKAMNTLLTIVVLVVAAFFAGGVLMPSQFEVSYSENVAAPPSKVFQCISQLETVKPMFWFRGTPDEVWESEMPKSGRNAKAKIKTQLASGELRYEKFHPSTEISVVVEGETQARITWVIGQDEVGSLVDVQIMAEGKTPFVSAWDNAWKKKAYPHDLLSLKKCE